MLGDRIAKARKNAGLSQRELAKRLDVTQQAIHQLEIGNYKSTKNLGKIAKILGVTVDWLLEDEDTTENSVIIKNQSTNVVSTSNLDDIQNEFIVNLPILSESQVDELLKMLRKSVAENEKTYQRVANAKAKWQQTNVTAQ